MAVLKIRKDKDLISGHGNEGDIKNNPEFVLSNKQQSKTVEDRCAHSTGYILQSRRLSCWTSPDDNTHATV